MFNRFTRTARELVSAACDEALWVGSPTVGAEHLLLAIAGGEGLAASLLAEEGADGEALRETLEEEEADALAALGISLESVRREVEERFGPAAWEGDTGRGGRPSFTGEAKVVLELSLRVALETPTRRIDPEHVLLALLRQRGRACALLRRLGVGVDALEEGLAAALRAESARQR